MSVVCVVRGFVGKQIEGAGEGRARESERAQRDRFMYWSIGTWMHMNSRELMCTWICICIYT